MIIFHCISRELSFGYGGCRCIIAISIIRVRNNCAANSWWTARQRSSRNIAGWTGVASGMMTSGFPISMLAKRTAVSCYSATSTRFQGRSSAVPTSLQFDTEFYWFQHSIFFLGPFLRVPFGTREIVKWAQSIFWCAWGREVRSIDKKNYLTFFGRFSEHSFKGLGGFQNFKKSIVLLI